MKVHVRTSQWAGLLTVLVVVGASFFAGGPAEAVTCSPSGHCFGLVGWSPPPSNLEGIAMAEETYALSVPNPPCNQHNAFVDNEFWLFTPNNGSHGTWVEQGDIEGNNCNDTTMYHFWADARPVDNGNINFHQDEGDSLNTVYGNFIYYSGNNVYTLIWYDATHNGQLVYSYSLDQSAPPDTNMQAGTEAGAQPTALSTFDSNLLWFNGTSWTTGWGGASVIAASPPTCTSWSSQPTSFTVNKC